MVSPWNMIIISAKLWNENSSLFVRFSLSFAMANTISYPLSNEDSPSFSDEPLYNS